MNEKYENNFENEAMAEETYEIVECNEIVAESDETESNLAATLVKGAIFVGGVAVGALGTKLAEPAKEWAGEKLTELKESRAIKKAERAAKKEEKKAKKAEKKAKKADKNEPIEGTAKEVTDK